MTQELIAQIKTYDKPSAQQKLLLELDAKPKKTIADMKNIKALVAAEVAAAKALAAKATAAVVLRDVAKAEAKAKKSARTHELCESAGLMMLAGFVDKATGKPTIDRGTLLGALLSVALIRDADMLQKWKAKGDALLAQSIKPANPAPTITGAQKTQPAPRIATVNTRLYSNISEKEEVKALGARFNGEGKFWYVLPGQDLAPFERWLTQPATQRPAFQDPDEK